MPFDREVWFRQNHLGLYNDDFLWANMIRAHGQLVNEWPTLNDNVLRRLMRIGIADWTGNDARLHPATQAMRHSTAVAVNHNYSG